jgi:hypothetical protein
MSGNNGPDWSLSSGIGGTADCVGLRRERALQVPNPDLVNSLEPGDVLGLVLHDGEAPAIAVVNDDGEELGALMPDQQLIDCLRFGIEFEAKVKSSEGGQVLLAVSPR